MCATAWRTFDIYAGVAGAILALSRMARKAAMASAIEMRPESGLGNRVSRPRVGRSWLDCPNAGPFPRQQRQLWHPARGAFSVLTLESSAQSARCIDRAGALLPVPAKLIRLIGHLVQGPTARTVGSVPPAHVQSHGKSPRLLPKIAQENGSPACNLLILFWR